ncbi:MAG: protein phosphatase 2C domain-containing protein [Verrucomicrobiota bacterium]
MILFSEGAEPDKNEDAVDVRQLFRGGRGWIGAIADGQGGHPGGARAAQLACEAALENLGAASAEQAASPTFWQELFRAVDGRVTHDSEAGLANLLAFVLTGDHVYGASCGDSAASLLTGGGSEEAQVLDLTAHQVKDPQIGSGETACTFFSAPLVEPWALLVMTDGVWKYAKRGRIADLLKHARGDEFSAQLEALGRLPGSGTFQDDFTFALVES